MRDQETDWMAVSLRTITFSMIVFSVVVTYYVMVVQQDYEIFTNPEGPETAEYFEEMQSY